MDLRSLFTPEAGQDRRAWLDGVDQRLGEGMDYYLGPTGIPNRVRNLASVFEMFSPAADVADAYDASGQLMRARSIPEGATAGAGMATALASLFVPGNQRAIAQGLDGLGTAARRFGSDQAGSVGRASGETPAAEVARMLREGRAAEVTDDMMARVDPQEMHRLYVGGATGQAMPMDEASRMARAREMGFTTGRNRQDPIAEMRREDNPQLVHYTNQDFDAFRIPERQNRQAIWATPDPSVNLATKDNFQTFADDGVTGIPIMARMTNRVSPYEFRMAGDPMTPGFPRNVTSADVAKANSVGADYAEAGLEYAIFDPRNIRSKFARFDPRLKHLSNLSAGVGGLGLTGLFMGEPTE